MKLIGYIFVFSSQIDKPETKAKPELSPKSLIPQSNKTQYFRIRRVWLLIEFSYNSLDYMGMKFRACHYWLQVQFKTKSARSLTLFANMANF